MIIHYLLFLIIGLCLMGYIIIKHERTAGRVERIISRLTNTISCPRFYCNIDTDVIAICTQRAFQDGLGEHMKKVESGELKSWDKVVVYARPTFTFAGKEQTQRPIHTGQRKDLERLIQDIIFWTTKMSTEGLSLHDYDKVVGTLMVKDSRLFVPWASTSKLTVEKQIELSPKVPLSEANEVIKDFALLNKK